MKYQARVCHSLAGTAGSALSSTILFSLKTSLEEEYILNNFFFTLWSCNIYFKRGVQTMVFSSLLDVLPDLTQNYLCFKGNRFGLLN